MHNTLSSYIWTHFMYFKTWGNVPLKTDSEPKRFRTVQVAPVNQSEGIHWRRVPYPLDGETSGFGLVNCKKMTVLEPN